MTMHPLLAAANEFLRDESRRRARGQRPRFEKGKAAQARASLSGFTEHALTETGGQGIADAAIRGARAVHIFGYSDSFDGAAETVIADILHAVAAQGKDPGAVLAQAFDDYAEEIGAKIVITPGDPDIAAAQIANLFVR